MRLIASLFLLSVFVVARYITLHRFIIAASISFPDAPYNAPSTPIAANNNPEKPSISLTTTMVNEAPGIGGNGTTSPATTKNGTPDSPPKSTFKPSGEPYDFAACLLMKDDNALLPEWLAYHYQVLPLRHLIIGLDPFALTSPGKIVEEYRKEGMDITVWQEDDYIFNGHLHYNRRVFANDTNQAKVAGYLWRQRAFLTKCLEEFKRRKNIRWTLLVDTDEYLTYNHFHLESETRNCRGGISQFCKDEDFRRSLLNGTHLRNGLPLDASKSIAEFIFELEQARNPVVATPRKSCFVVPRVLIGPEESSPEDVLKQAVDGLDPFNFLTLRYRKFKTKISLYTGKSLVDARLFRGKGVISNPHKIHDRFCLGNDYPDFSSSLLKVHHYTGSFETYASRKGSSSEAVKKMWEDRAVWPSAGADDDVQSWLKSFVDNVGLKRAKELTVELLAWAEDKNDTSSL